MEQGKWFVPNSLDELPQFLFLNLHQLVGMATFICLGMVSGSLFLGVVLGALFVYFYARLRAGRHSHFLLHMAYWYLPKYVVQLQNVPPAYLRIYVG